LTVRERATHSNTICGDLESARSLERMGFLRIERVAQDARGQLAFFELTEAGEAYVTRHFTVADPSERS
jgi:DNA-binding MarR family transcriptional regulator